MDRINIPFSELTFSFARSSGPGGQNVNKVNTKVVLYWDPDSTIACGPQVIERFKEKFKKFILADGKFQLICQSNRSQKANIDESIRKLHEMINSVARPPKVRKATKPTKSSIRKRLDSKKKDSDKKRLRKKGYE